MAGVSSPRNGPRFLPPRTSRTVAGPPSDKASAVADKRSSLTGERESGDSDSGVLGGRSRAGTLTQKDLENIPTLTNAKKLLEKKYSDTAFTSGAYKKQRTQKTGWLMAQKVFTGGSRVTKKKWSLYWCVVRNATISFYKDMRETRLKGLMSLRDVRVLDVTRHVEPVPAKKMDQMECAKCNAKFGIMKKRFSCKNCGSFFCEHCSTKKLPLLRYGRVLPARVCDTCYTRVFAELTASEVARCCYDETRKVWRLEDNKFSLPPDQRSFLFGLKNAEGEVWLHAETNMEATAWLDTLDRVRESLQKEKLGAQSQWEIDFDELTIIKKVGAGAYGEVYSARLWGTLVAVKRLNIAKFPDQARLLADLQSEAQILSQLRHPNVVLYVGAATKQSNVCIVTEWCAMGSLYDVLHDHSISLSARKMATLAMGVAQGMNYLHNLPDKIIHRDLKSHNVLIDKDWNVKVADFGLSRVRKKAGEGKRVQKVTQEAAHGTPEWMAPEIMAPTPGKPETEKIDVYSFGVLLCEVLTRALPFRDVYHIESFDDIVDIVVDDGALPTIPSWAEFFLKPLILQCLSRDPEKRPSFSEIITALSDLLTLDEEQYLHRFDLPRVMVLLSSTQPVDQALGAREFYAMMVADKNSNLVLAQDEGNYLLHFNKLMRSPVAAVQISSVKALFALLKASKSRLAGNVRVLVEKGALTRLVQLWQCDDADLTKEVSPLLILMVTTQPSVLPALDGSGLAVVEFVLGAHIREETDELQRLTQLLKTKKDVFAIATQLRVGGANEIDLAKDSTNSRGSHVQEDNEEREESTGSHQKESEADDDDEDEMVLDMSDEDCETPSASDVASESDDFLTPASFVASVARLSIQQQRKQEFIARTSEMYPKRKISSGNNFPEKSAGEKFLTVSGHSRESVQNQNNTNINNNTNNNNNLSPNNLQPVSEINNYKSELGNGRPSFPLRVDVIQEEDDSKILEDKSVHQSDESNGGKSRFSMSNMDEPETSVLVREYSIASESSQTPELGTEPSEETVITQKLSDEKPLPKRPPDPPPLTTKLTDDNLPANTNLSKDVSTQNDVTSNGEYKNDNDNSNRRRSNHSNDNNNTVNNSSQSPQTPTKSISHDKEADKIRRTSSSLASQSFRPHLSTKQRSSRTGNIMRGHAAARLSENSLATTDLSQRLALLSKRHELHVQRAKPRFECESKCRPSVPHALPVPAVALDLQLVAFLHAESSSPEMKLQGNAVHNDFAVLFDPQVRSWIVVCLVFLPSALLVFPTDTSDPHNALVSGAKPLCRIRTATGNDDSIHRAEAAERATIGGESEVRDRSSSIPALLDGRDRSFSMSNLAAATRRLRHTRSSNLHVWTGLLTSFVAAKEEHSHCLIVDNNSQTWCFAFATESIAKKWRQRLLAA